MCGIAGFFGNINLNKKIINSTLNLMSLRGPDSQNYSENNLDNILCYLLHSRLNIIDLHNRSNQPFCNKDYELIFNGEIYNYIELKNKLEKINVFTKTDSDTEVLLLCYINFGEKCFEMFEGMWSLAILNKKEKNIILSRDRFGEKPLYYLSNSKGIYFGSECKFIINMMENNLDINFEHIKDYLFLGYKSLYKNNSYFFKNIKQIESGTYHKISKDDYIIKKYFNKDIKTNYKLDIEDCITQVKEKFINSLKIRLRADVPVAVCLSGGIDSSAIASISTKVLGKKIDTYSIIDKDPRYDEYENIKKINADINIKGNYLKLDNKNFFERLRKQIKYHNAPIYTITWYIHSLLTKKISEDNKKVILSGNAADEMLGGYYDHYLLHLYECKHNNYYFENNKNNWIQYIEKNVRNKSLKNHSLYIQNNNFRDHIYDEKDEIKKFSKTDLNTVFFEEDYHESLMKNRMMNELFHETTPAILNQDDLNSMMYSIENRSPFLDKEFFNFCFSIPSHFYINNGFNKYIFREAMKNIIHEEVRTDRRKKGFNASINTLVDFSDKHTSNYLFNKSSIMNELCNLKEIKINSEKSENLPNYLSKFLFNFINVKIFLEEFA